MSVRRSLVLLALLAACTADPGGTQSESDTAGSAATSSSSEPPTTSTASSGEASTSDAATSVVTTDATSSEATSTTGEATSTTSTTSTTGEATLTTGSTSTDTSSGADTDAGTTGPDGVLGPAAMDAMDALAAAVAGVTYPSESDYPWVVVGFADAAPVSEANVKDVIADVYVPHPGEAALVDRTIELRTLAQLMDPLTTPQDWWDDYYKMLGAQYTVIRMVLEAKLVDIQVFRIGEQQGNVLQGAIDIYVLGSTADGDVVGMWTVSIET
jgi:hypothetical protein